MPEQHYPASFLHLHGDVQEAVQMEICKTEREINWSLHMISTESGEVSGGYFSLMGQLAALHHRFTYPASLL